MKTMLKAVFFVSLNVLFVVSAGNIMRRKKAYMKNHYQKHNLLFGDNSVRTVSEITYAVGKCDPITTAFNYPGDVRVIQTLLNSAFKNSDEKQLSISGTCDAFTISAIEKFQVSIFNGFSDGCIEPNKTTWKKLIAKVTASQDMQQEEGKIQSKSDSDKHIYMLGGDMIATIPIQPSYTEEKRISNKNLLILFGGAGWATPEWMLEQIPTSYFQKSLILIVPQRTGYLKSRQIADEFFSTKGFSTVNNGKEGVSICGFSGGGKDVQLAKGEFHVVGLIDPFTVKVWAIQENYSSNVILEYRVNNWSRVKYSSTRTSLPILAENIKQHGGYAEEVDISHRNFPRYFLKKFESRFLES